MSTWALKSGVDPTGITAQLSSALDAAQSIFFSLGQPFTVTSLSEGQHMTDSKHYIGQAADLRTRDVDPAAIPALLNDLRSSLGSGYTVINEGDHIHVQYNGVGTALQPSDGGYDPTAGEAGPPTINFDSILSDLGFSTPSGDGSGVAEAGISGGLLVGLIVGGIALFLIFRD